MKKLNTPYPLIWLCFLVALVFLFNGCGPSKTRNPVPEGFNKANQINGLPYARAWGDTPPINQDEFLQLSPEELEKTYPTIINKKALFLAISGGGGNGAFGAGLLTGWTQKETRPEFFAVTGISAGALTAPFAFLGPEYDSVLKEIWTRYSTKDLFKQRSFFDYITNDAFGESVLLRKVIKHHLTTDLIEKIGREYTEKGRRLYIGTTNLDAMRPVIWNIGLIAASHLPDKEELIYDILLASASIPGVFPPVYIKVQAGGQTYDEIHVDGGTSSQVFAYPPGIQWKKIKNLMNFQENPSLFVIRNAKLTHSWKAIDPTIESIASRSIDSLIHNQGLGDIYQIYLSSIYDEMNFNLAYIGKEFNHEPEELFDRAYMEKLFNYGIDQVLNDKAWVQKPPRFKQPMPISQ